MHFVVENRFVILCCLTRAACEHDHFCVTVRFDSLISVKSLRNTDIQKFSLEKPPSFETFFKNVSRKRRSHWQDKSLPVERLFGLNLL